MELNKLTVLVTGAASGIGHALSRGFLNDGATVVAVDRNTEGLEPLANQGAIILKIDVSDPAKVEGMVQTAVDKTGRLDVLFNNAGGRGAADFDFLAKELNTAGWRTVSINPRGAGNSKGSLEDVTLHTYAEDVSEIIKNLDGIPAAVLGHAFGNRVARCFAADYPEQPEAIAESVINFLKDYC